MSDGLQPGQVFAKDFQVERKLSQGGMGAVYVARQLSTDKLRALKLMLPQLAPDTKSRQRFIDEARIGARIDSEHVVEVVAAGIDEATGAPWLAMELLDGEDLGALTARRGPLPVGEVREILLQAGHALALAHANGIVHRDLKPENLYLARARRQGQASVVKVLDFGIATALPTGGAGVVTTAVGSPFWMAPEQATPGAPLAPSTDVWALGLIAFQLLTGSSYWKTARVSDASIGAVLTEILMEPLVPASARAAALGLSPPPAGFDEWFARCVSRAAEARFADAASCIEALDALLARVAPRAPVNFSSPSPEPVVPAPGLDATFQRATPYPAPEASPPVAPVAPTRPPVAMQLEAVPAQLPSAPARARGASIGVAVGVVGVALAVAAVMSRPEPLAAAPPMQLAAAAPVAFEPAKDLPPAAPLDVAPPEAAMQPPPAPPPAMAGPSEPREVALPRQEAPGQRPAARASRAFSLARVKVARGDGCKAGRGVTFEEAGANVEPLCDLIGQWSIVRLAGGASMDGRGYHCKLRPFDERKTGESLCLE